MLLIKANGCWCSVETLECQLICQDALVYIPFHPCGENSFVNAALSLKDVSLHCSDAGKFQYSPERMMKAECCQSDSFHLGGRNGRRRSGKIALFCLAALHTATTSKISKNKSTYHILFLFYRARKTNHKEHRRLVHCKVVHVAECSVWFWPTE